MFLSVGQTIATDNEYTRVRSSHQSATDHGDARIIISFGNLTSILLSVDEAKKLFLELEVSLREAYDDEEVTA
jgi:hypothetical protein